MIFLKEQNFDFVLLESNATTVAGLPAQQVVSMVGGKKYLDVFIPRADRVIFSNFLYKILHDLFVDDFID